MLNGVPGEDGLVEGDLSLQPSQDIKLRILCQEKLFKVRLKHQSCRIIDRLLGIHTITAFKGLRPSTSGADKFQYVKLSKVCWDLLPIIYIARLVLHVWRMVTEYNAWRMILKSCAWCLISKCCVWRASDWCLAQCFEKLRLAGIWRASRAMFWNHMSGAMFQNQASGATFQNHPPDAIFYDYASDVCHEWHSVTP